MLDIGKLIQEGQDIPESIRFSSMLDIGKLIRCLMNMRMHPGSVKCFV